MSMLAASMSTGLMPAGTICLTFDDGPGHTPASGPGPRTLAIGEYLASQGVEGTFFMCGNQVVKHPDVPTALLQLGHRIGNHTVNHTVLTTLDDDEVRREIAGARDMLVDFGVPSPMPFRPPYGAWDERTANAVNADGELAASLQGPYGWDIHGFDWEDWERGAANGRAVVERVLTQAVEVGSGVVLLHDSTGHEDDTGATMRAGNQTLDVVARLLPALLDRGFVVRGLPFV